MGVIVQQSIKGAIAHYIGVFIGIVSTLFLVPMMLPPEVYGLTQVLYEAALLLCVLGQLGTSSSIIRFFPYFKSDNPAKKHNGFFFYIMLMPIIGSAIVVPLYLLLRGPICDFFITRSPMFIEFYYWVIPFAIFLIFWTIFENYANAQMHIVVPKIIREIGIRVMLLVAYVLYFFGYINLQCFIFLCIAPYCVAMLISFFYISKISPISLQHDFSYINKPLLKKIRNYTLFLVISALSTNILRQLDTFMLSSLKGLYDVGIYRVLLYMGIIVEIPMRSITAISSPIAAAALKDNDLTTANNLYKKVSLTQLILGSFIFIIVWANIDNIFMIIPNGENYVAWKWVVFFIGIERLIVVSLNFGSILISFSRFYYWELFFTFFIVAIGIITNLWLIPKIGMTGAAIATLITTTIVYCVRQWIVLVKIKGNPFSKGTLKQFLLAGVMFAFSLILPRWTQNPILDIIYRTAIIGGIMGYAIYKLKISAEVCSIIDVVINNIKTRLRKIWN